MILIKHFKKISAFWTTPYNQKWQYNYHKNSLKNIINKLLNELLFEIKNINKDSYLILVAIIFFIDLIRLQMDGQYHIKSYYILLLYFIIQYNINLFDNNQFIGI